MDSQDHAMKKKPYKIKDITRQIKKAVVAANLRELQKKSMEKFIKTSLPRIHLDSDGTEIDDEDYFQTLEPNTELIAVFSGEQWIDPTQYLTITTHNSDESLENSDVEKIHLKKLISLLKMNLWNLSILNESDLELLSNLDPNSVSDVITKEYLVQLKEASARILDEKRDSMDSIELMKLMGKHLIINNKQGSTEHRPFSPSSSTTSLSTMSSFSSNNQQ